MAINRISGRMLQDDLQRDDDLSIQGNLLYVDVGNSRVGLGTTSPSESLDVFGKISVGNINVFSDGIESSQNIVFSPNGSIDMSGSQIRNISDPITDTDAATRKFVDDSVASVSIDISDGNNTSPTNSGGSIFIIGSENQILSELNGDTFTLGLTEDVTVDGNLTIGNTLFVDGIDIGNIISGDGNLTLSGEISGNTIIANSALALPYLNSNALVFTDDNDTLTTYPEIRYDGNGELTILDVPFRVDNVKISNTSITSNGNLDIFTASSDAVKITNLAITDNETPDLIYFVDSQGRSTTDANLSFSNSTLTVSGVVTAESLSVGNTTIGDGEVESSSDLTLTANNNGFVTIGNNTGFIVAVGTTADRPSNPVAGTLRWNSDTNLLEVYDGNEWEALGTDVTFITSQVIQGDDSTTVFSLDQEATTSGILVYINGVAQLPGSSYSVLNDQITFTEPPQEEDTVEIRFISLSQTVSALTNESGETAIRVKGDGEIVFISESNKILDISTSTIEISSGVDFTIGGRSVGVLDSPQRLVEENTTILNEDRGGHLYIKGTDSVDITVPNNNEISLPIGTQVSIISHSTSNNTLLPDANVLMYLSGNSVSSSRTIEPFGRADLIKVAENIWALSGFSIT